MTSWGQELWDQYPALSDHTHKGIEFLDKYGSFMRERCVIELEYAGKLKRLAKHHQIKKKDEDENQFSYCKAFLMMLNELTDYAGQHEIIAENITQNIVKEISLLLKELKEERKKYLQEGQRHQNAYTLSLTQLDKAKKSYEKAFKEADKAHEAFLRADADLNLSRAEVEKAKNFSIMKGQIGDETKTEYANQLQKTNELQNRHFNELMPKVFNQLQELEERRITCLQSFIKQSALIERQVLPIIDKCVEGVIAASDSMVPQDDSLLVVERHKSGNLPPEDFPFEDLSNPATITIRPGDESIHSGGKGSNHLNYSNSIKSETLRGTLSVARFRKRGGLFGMFSSNKGLNFDEKSDDYAELPPNQRRKKIVAKIDTIQSQINQELSVRDGLLKMKAAYESNPVMGDPHSVEGQMAENSQKLDKLKTELAKFQGYLDEVDGKPSTPYASKKSHHRNSVSESESLSRSASDSSFSHQNGSSTNPAAAGNNNSLTTTTTTAAQQDHHHHISPPSVNSSSATSSTGSAAANRNNVALQNHRNSNGNLANGSNNLVDSLRNHINARVNGGSSEHSPESGISTSHLSIPDADYADGDVPDGEGEFEDVLPVLGKARALYPFEAQSEGSIGMEEGEDLEVVELDQGDGWTRVRKVTSEEEGFVPTSYIEVEIASC